MASARRCTAFFAYMLSFLVFLLALMAPYWYKFKGMTLVGAEEQFSLSGRNPLFDIVHEKTVHGGLWLRCETTLRTVCDIGDFSETTVDRRIAFGCMMVALFTHLISIGLFIRSLTRDWGLRSSAIGLLISVAFMILAIIAFASSDYRSHLDWGFYLAVAALVITLACAVCMLVLHSEDEEEEKGGRYDTVPTSSSLAPLSASMFGKSIESLA